jgi:hypothetical protein
MVAVAAAGSVEVGGGTLGLSVCGGSVGGLVGLAGVAAVGADVGAAGIGLGCDAAALSVAVSATVAVCAGCPQPTNSMTKITETRNRGNLLLIDKLVKCCIICTWPNVGFN